MPKEPDDSSKRSVHRELIAEINRIVSEVVARGGILHVADHAQRLFDTYGHAGYSKGRIIDELIAAASAAKVPVEIYRA